MIEKDKISKILFTIACLIIILLVICNFKTQEEQLNIQIAKVASTNKIIITTSGATHIKTIDDINIINEFTDILAKIKYSDASVFAQRGQNYEILFYNDDKKIFKIKIDPDFYIDNYPKAYLEEQDKVAFLNLLKEFINQVS